MPWKKMEEKVYYVPKSGTAPKEDARACFREDDRWTYLAVQAKNWAGKIGHSNTQLELSKSYTIRLRGEKSIFLFIGHEFDTFNTTFVCEGVYKLNTKKKNTDIYYIKMSALFNSHYARYIQFASFSMVTAEKRRIEHSIAVEDPKVLKQRKHK